MSTGVLIISGDEPTLLDVANMVRACGADPLVARKLDHAMDAAQRARLVVLDGRTRPRRGHATGLPVLAKLRAEGWSMPAILFADTVTSELWRSGASLGVIDCLQLSNAAPSDELSVDTLRRHIELHAPRTPIALDDLIGPSLEDIRAQVRRYAANPMTS